MKRFITAGAGSGKTYRITTEVARRVKEEGLRPEQVIMTTFTKAAAQELREKAKKELANLGLFKEVQQMEHALIGTVHSVANTFLTKYWYLLGITPDAAALEEDELQMFRDESLRGLLEKEDRKFLYQYCERYEIPDLQETKSGLNYEFWKADLCNVLNYIQWYSITDTQLDKSLNETTESIVQLLEPREEINLSNPPESLKATFHLISETVYNAKKSGMKERHQKLLLGIDLKNLSIDSIKQLVDIIKDRKIEESCKEFVEWSNELLSITQDKAKDHRKYGPTQGAKNVEIICEEAYKMGINYLTVYAFSTENWSRPQDEVDALMKLLRNYMKTCQKTAAKNNMCVRIIGDKTRLDEDLQEQIAALEDATKNNTGLHFQVALNYGSKDEMLRAMNRIKEDMKQGLLEDCDITESIFSDYLDTKGIPNPDLLIRTSGEKRLSNFLLWQLAYSEFYFADVHWPDFNEAELKKAIDNYENRHRRFGGI